MMKTLLKTFLISLFVVLGINTINGQCNNGSNYYPSSTFTPTDNAWSYATTNNWAGEVIKINAKTGYSYIFSTCSSQGGVTASYDTQLSLYDNTGTNVAFNDDYSGCNYRSVISYTATYDGVYYLHLNEYNCISNQTNTRVMIYSTPATPCASLDYTQDFESGSTNMLATVGSQASATLDNTSANVSSYGLHMQGNTSSLWYTPYNTGADAFNSSPQHISSVSREICASSQSVLTLTFDKKQTSSYNVNYSWFRLTVNGNPVSDASGTTYFNRVVNSWTTMTYDLSAYANTSFTLAWEFCGKYRTGYTSVGDGGDAVFIDNISLVESTAVVVPSSPGTISGDHQPNEGVSNLTYTVVADNNVDTYTWTFPTNWTIVSGQGTNSITVTSGNYDGNISVVATNSAGSSAATLLAVDVALTEDSFPYSATFDNETNDVTSASTNGFSFDSNGWRNISGDDGDWRTDNGSTPSSNTGTIGIDHSLGNSTGKFLYIESSSPNHPSKTFELISPPFDLRSTSTPIFTFWFNMETNSSSFELALKYSLDNGSTWSSDVNFMDVNVSNTANIIGNMGSSWRQGLVDLTHLRLNSSVMFKFTGTTGSSWNSDIMIDDIKLVDVNSTSVDVGENLTISSNYNGATGFVLNGIDAQIVTSNNSTIPDLTINNSNGVTINGDLTATTLNLTNGKLTMGSGSTLTTSIISSFSSSGYVIGALTRPSSSTTTMTFPVGDATNYRPTSIKPQNSTSTNYTVTYNNTSHSSVNFSQYPNGTPTDVGVHSIANDYWWDIDRSNGGAPAKVAFLWDASMNVSVPSDIIVAHYNSTTNKWEKTGTQTITGTASSGTVTSDYTNDFSPFGFGSGSGGNALPVELLSFTGVERNGDVVLNWVVASQVNNSMFQIHKSLNARDWDLVGEVEGDGNTNAEFSYYLLDGTPYTGTSYYKLTQIDYDGKSESFDPIKVYVENNIGLVISPNPVKGDLHLIAGEDLRGTTDITIFNVLGEVVYEEEFEGRFNTFNLNLRDFDKGSYIMKINNLAKQGTLKFVIE